MSEAHSALPQATAAGFCDIHEAGLQGMITLRGELSSKNIRAAVKKHTHLDVPDVRGIKQMGDKAVAWMSPDELMILVPYHEGPDTAAGLEKELEGSHHLVALVSDARALFSIRGSGAREVLAKLSPADLSPAGFGENQITRSRLAQIPAAFWFHAPDEIRLVCFRSVAGYAFGLLRNAAAKGSQPHDF